MIVFAVCEDVQEQPHLTGLQTQPSAAQGHQAQPSYGTGHTQPPSSWGYEAQPQCFQTEHLKTQPQSNQAQPQGFQTQPQGLQEQPLSSEEDCPQRIAEHMAWAVKAIDDILQPDTPEKVEGMIPNDYFNTPIPNSGGHAVSLVMRMVCAWATGSAQARCTPSQACAGFRCS